MSEEATDRADAETDETAIDAGERGPVTDAGGEESPAAGERDDGGEQDADGGSSADVDAAGNAFVFDEPSADAAASSTSTEDGPSAGGDATPFSGLADRVRDDARRSTEGSAGDAPDQDPAALFDREAVPELDAKRLWDRLERDEDAPTSEVQERSIRQLSKRAYCESCEHFSEPPGVACSHEGTTILELTDLETFTVANCPVVREEEALEESD